MKKLVFLFVLFSLSMSTTLFAESAGGKSKKCAEGRFDGKSDEGPATDTVTEKPAAGSDAVVETVEEEDGES